MKKIIMLGDSIIDWNYNSPYINYGKNGFRSRDVFWLLEENTEISGDIAILLVGVNDFFTNMEMNKTIEYYEKIIFELKNRFKKLILISLLPTDRIYINKKIESFNSYLQNNYFENYLDINSYLKDENSLLNRFYTTDGIHLNHAGYDIFNKKLDERIKNI